MASENRLTMNRLSEDFNSLHDEYQKLIHLAEQKNEIQISPIQKLKGGKSGAYLFLVRITTPGSSQLQHLILKLDVQNKNSKSDEFDRHDMVLRLSPEVFVRDHVADIRFDRLESDGIVAIFYDIAGQSLTQFKSLAGYYQQKQLEKIFSLTNDILLNEWNKNLTIQPGNHPQKMLQSWLGYRLQPGGNIEKFLEEVCHVPQSTPGWMINENIFPNPWLYARNFNLWENIRPIDVISGFQHGDLNIYNILIRFRQRKSKLIDYYLIDFALSKSGMPLLYDQRYLEVSYLIREISRVDINTWMDFIVHYSEEDIVDPASIPSELSGAASVINSGRKAFEKWIKMEHPSLFDDLWCQFWLAAVAAGLNYCNKKIISNNERLAGLIYAAVHLKRLHRLMGIPPPREIRNIEINLSKKQGHETLDTRLERSKRLHNLPTPPTPFVGRTKEIEMTLDLMHRAEVRFITLTGPGGVGKTRLAIEIAYRTIGILFEDIHFIDLTSIRAPDSFMPHFARTLGLREVGDESAGNLIARFLGAGNKLIMMDNFEQVTSAAKDLNQLLQKCPNLKFLVTSREALHLRGEKILNVPPLELPGREIHDFTPEQIISYESIRLFVDRARDVHPGFGLTKKNMQPILSICERAEGLPLAIELAAARTQVFTPEEILKNLENRLAYLKDGAQDRPDRHKTMRNTIEWSYDMLNPAEQQFFAMLAIFHGCNQTALDSVLKGISSFKTSKIDVIEGISSLVQKSLVRRTSTANGISRFILFEIIREFAREKLDDMPAFKKEVIRSHARHYTELAGTFQHELNHDKRDQVLQKIKIEAENLRAAWDYWISISDLKSLRKLLDVLWVFYDANGWLSSSVELTGQLLIVLKSYPSTPEKALEEIMIQTSLARVQMAIFGCTAEVEEAYKKALELCDKYGNIPQSFPVLRSLCSFYIYLGDMKQAAAFGRRIIEIAEALDDRIIKIEGNLLFGYSLVFSGDIQKGYEYLEIAHSLYDSSLYSLQSLRYGTNPGVTCNTTSALCSWMLGLPDKAVQLTEDAIVLAKELNHPPTMAYALFHTGLLNLWRNEESLALENARSVLKIADRHGLHIWKSVATCLHGAAISGSGQPEKGIEEINSGIRLYSESNNPPIFWPMLLMLLAKSYIDSAQAGKALEVISESLKIIGEKSENPILPELYRLQGVALLLHSNQDITKAESLFLKSISIAKKQGTIMYELKSSLNLYVLWKEKGKKDHGIQLLEKAYNKFTEGFSTQDLSSAKDILNGNVDDPS